MDKMVAPPKRVTYIYKPTLGFLLSYMYNLCKQALSLMSATLFQDSTDVK